MEIFVIAANKLADFAGKPLPVDIPLQRIRRGNELTAACITVGSVVDIVANSIYLHRLDDPDKGLRVANEILPIMPTLFCGLRFVNSVEAIAGLFILNGIATSTPLLLGMNLLFVDVAAVDNFVPKQR